MRVIVIGLGTQGYKRRKACGADFVGAVDPANQEAEYNDISDVALDTYDAALCCVPDAPKIELLNYLAENGKHTLVEKPLFASNTDDISNLESVIKSRGVVCYTAYNHRFEPHFVRMRDTIASGVLGEIYRCRMFYGNGTARLVRESEWRDTGAGVLPDLGSHLLDTCRYWFGDGVKDEFDIYSVNRFENRAPDHIVIGSEASRPKLELEMSLLMWRNHFTCDVFGSDGTAHITSLCKWGPATFTLRTRVLPSGKPPEENETLVEDDPTWAAEYAHFKGLIESGAITSLENDIWLQNVLGTLGTKVQA